MKANDPKLTKSIIGVDHTGNKLIQDVVVEKGLTIFLNSQEVVTSMTIGDHPKYMAVGFLVNQNMLSKADIITSIDFDEEIGVIVVRTKKETNHEKRIKNKIRTSGCAYGTIFGDVLEEFDKKKLDENIKINSNSIYKILKEVNTYPSLYFKSVLYMDVFYVKVLIQLLILKM